MFQPSERDQGVRRTPTTCFGSSRARPSQRFFCRIRRGEAIDRFTPAGLGGGDAVPAVASRCGFISWLALNRTVSFRRFRGHPLLRLGATHYCAWGPAILPLGASSCPDGSHLPQMDPTMPNGADLLPDIPAVSIDPNGVRDDPLHGRVVGDAGPRAQALSGGAFRQWQLHPGLLVRSLATPIGLSWAMGPSPAHGTGTVT